MDLEGTPVLHGYHTPAEWEPHSQCWMGWPERPDNWRDRAVHAQRIFANVAAAISKFEPITVCANRDQWMNARKQLSSSIRVVEMSMNDSWLRDIGATFIVKKNTISASSVQNVTGIDWNFNAWGGHLSPPRSATEYVFWLIVLIYGLCIIPLGHGVYTGDEGKPRCPGTRLAASYINFYIANGGIIIPRFGDQKWDAEAI